MLTYTLLALSGYGSIVTLFPALHTPSAEGIRVAHDRRYFNCLRPRGRRKSDGRGSASDGRQRSRLRSLEEGMPIASRYFATVRRATLDRAG